MCEYGGGWIVQESLRYSRLCEEVTGAIVLGQQQEEGERERWTRDLPWLLVLLEGWQANDVP